MKNISENTDLIDREIKQANIVTEAAESNEDFLDDNIESIVESTKKAKKPKAKKGSRFKSDNPEKNYFVYEEEMASKKGVKPFATGFNFYKLFWVFFIGCILGVIIEMLFCLAVEQKLESRTGLVIPPFNPVYGFGAVVITLGLYFMRNARDLWVFFGGAALGGAFEYICSWYQETFLGTVSWDYTGQFGSIGNGRTSFVYMLFWGLLTILWLKFIYPFMSRMIEKIPKKVGIPLTWVLVAFMIFNMLLSGCAVYRMNMRNSGVEATNYFTQTLDEIFTDEVMDMIYPNMEITNPKK